MLADDSLPDFTNFPYTLVTPPAQPKGCGWDKLKECERRLALYRWAEHLNDPGRPQQRVFLDDCLSAFLLTLEAALQFVGDQLKKGKTIDGLQSWLEQLPEHDLHVRGLRTLRHFAAHIEIKPVSSAIIASATTLKRKWLLPQLDQVVLQKLKTPVLDDGDLSEWNTLVQRADAASILEHSLRQVHAILLRAERLL